MRSYQREEDQIELPSDLSIFFCAVQHVKWTRAQVFRLFFGVTSDGNGLLDHLTHPDGRVGGHGGHRLQLGVHCGVFQVDLIEC